MSVQNKYLSEDGACCSLKLLEVLQQMSAQGTNAVLQVLAEVDHLETECRYPENGLLFAGKRWRAFYHCHEATSMHADEHGHFHLFTDIGDQSWAHVAGLSVDAEGQPLQWFAVNRWVTDGPWLQREDLFHQITSLTDEEDLVAGWLALLVRLYRVPLYELFDKRDEQIKSALKKRARDAILDDCDIYTLATLPIDLQAELEKHLLCNHETVHATTKNKGVR